MAIPKWNTPQGCIPKPEFKLETTATAHKNNPAIKLGIFLIRDTQFSLSSMPPSGIG